MARLDRYRRDIQVLRGIALIAVIFFHSNERLFPLGYLGVDVFFVDLQEKDPAEIGFERMCSLIKETPALTFSKFIEYKLFSL